MMATYRCLACGGLYVTPQPSGLRYFHTCPLSRMVIDDPVRETSKEVPILNRRDENVVQDDPGGPVHIKAAGAGRELLAEEDLLSGATVDQAKELRPRLARGVSPTPGGAPNPPPAETRPRKPGEERS